MKKNVFISYRRADTRYIAHIVQRELASKFGEERVFYDQGIQPGDNFVDELKETLGTCDVLLTLIGPDWLNEENKARLHDEKDWVRVEITTALDRRIRVIPVVVRGATLPEPKNLPVELAQLPNLQAVTLREDIDYGLHQLVRAIDKDLQLEGKPSKATKEEKIGGLVRRARLAKADADQMYLKQVKQAKPLDFDAGGTVSVDLSEMLVGFDSDAHEAKLQEAYALLKEAQDLDNTNVEVMLVMAELLIELTPDDPTDEQELLYKVKSLIPNPRDETERYQLAKATFLLASSGEHVHDESLRDARAIFEQLGRRDWVRQCDDLLAATTGSQASNSGQQAPVSPSAQTTPQQFHPVGTWTVRDSSYCPSAWQFQFSPNGTFQGYQQTPAMGIEGPVQGQWGFDPFRNMLVIQGVLNGMVPFGTNIIIQGRNASGWYGVGADGVAYALARA